MRFRQCRFVRNEDAIFKVAGLPGGRQMRVSFLFQREPRRYEEYSSGCSIPPRLSAEFDCHRLSMCNSLAPRPCIRRIVSLPLGLCRLCASPESHLTSFRPVENVTLYAWGCLIALCNPIRGVLHEFGKSLHPNHHPCYARKTRLFGQRNFRLDQNRETGCPRSDV